MKSEIDQIRTEIHRYLAKDPSLAIGYIEQFKTFLSRNRSMKMESEYHYYIGLYYQNISNLADAIKNFKLAIEIGHDIAYNELLQKSYNSLGACYRIQQDYKKAIEMYSNAVSGPDISAKAATYNNIAIIYNDLKEYELSLDYYQKAASSFIDSEQWQYVVIVKNNIAKLLMQMNKYDKVYEVLNSTKRIIEKVDFLPLAALITSINFARLYIHDEKFGDALVELEKAKEISVDNKLNQNIILIYTLLGEVHENLKNFEEAIDYYNKAIEESNDISIYAEINIREKIVKFYDTVHDYYRAYKEAQKIILLKEKLYENEKLQELNKLVIQFETREKENEIAKLNIEKELSKIVLEKSVEIEKANSKLQEYNDELVQFSYAISHDFREPVRMISTFTQLLQRSLNQKLSNHEEELMDYIISNTVKIERLISDLYKYSKVDNIELMIEKFHFNELVKDILKLRGFHNNDLNIKINYSIEIEHYKSPISQILQNLVSNSIKYKNPLKSLELELSAEEINNTYLILVKDNGIGIEIENQEKIFQLFKRINNDNSNDSTGLGLALCQKICRKLGGEILVYSDGINQGSLFTVKIPKLSN